ncbi:MAG: type II secretion system minor pseudopilin GspI [Leptothrix sp. (in: b-proteobacteria)]
MCRADIRRRSGGMTLIEVLVALAIVAITLAAGIKAAAALTANTERFADTMAAQWCADNQLTALRLARQFPPVGDSDFSCEQAGRSYQGKLIVRPTPNPNFRRVDAQVSDAEGHSLLRLSTIQSRFSF